MIDPDLSLTGDPFMTMLSKLYIATVLVAFCSISYELLLAYGLSIALGQSFVRFSVTIGLYLFSLGMGSLLLDAFKLPRTVLLLLRLELLLAALGLSLPLLMFALDAATQIFGLWSGWNWMWCHVLVLLIGLLSGAELPLFMSLANEVGGEKASFRILAADYFATFLGAVLFPFLIYRYLGMVAGCALIGGLNLLAAWILWSPSTQSKTVFAAALSLTITALLIGLFEGEVRGWISHHLILANASTR